LSYLLGCIAIFNFTMAGSASPRKRMIGWAGGFCSQFLWAYYAISLEQHGLLIMAFLYAFVYARNFWRTKDGKDR
jgi:hypothetical protein